MAATVRSTTNALISATEGKKADPADDLLMADTGQLPRGRYEARCLIRASVVVIMDIEHRNAANDANLTGPIGIGTPAAGSAEYILTFDLRVAVNERIRVIMDGAITGTAQAFLNVERLG